MPDRIIRTGILSSDRVNRLTWPAEVFYRRLMSVADDFGRFDGRPAILRASLYALKLDKVSESDVGKWLGECSAAGLVRCYAVDAKPFVEIDRFDQRTRAKSSKWPAPLATDGSTPSSADKYPRVTADGGHPRTESESDAKSETDSDANRADGSALTDEAWLERLSANPAYAGLNVRDEYGKMTVWCETNKKQPTRRRFVNWLNRCDKPMAMTTSPAQARRIATGCLHEPDNWRELLRLHHADNPLLQELANRRSDWGQFNADSQQTVAAAVKAIPFDKRREA